MTTVTSHVAQVTSVVQSSTVPMTRREFLYYVWGASMALFMAEAGGAILWFALPRFKAGEFGGAFAVPVEKIPPPDSPEPVDFPDGRFWLINAGEKIANDPRTPPGYVTGMGVVAIYKICVHLGCLYKWVPTNNRFECPCHGSKYLLNGVRLEGPARRNLDRFIIEAVDASGNVLAQTKSGNRDQDPTAGLPIQIPAGAVSIIANTGKRINGERNPK